VSTEGVYLPKWPPALPLCLGSQTFCC